MLLLLPPGSAKSTYTSKLFPAWWLARNPGSAIIAASHTAGLAADFGRNVRDLVEEHSARLNLRLRPDARATQRFLTDKGGEYFAIGVHGAVTGRRADLAIIDDPVRSLADAESAASREHLWNWFRTELTTRMKPRGRIVVAMTRWHADDLAGRLIAQQGWTVLRLPALAEPGDFLGRAEGEALWPEWEDKAALLIKQVSLGERHFSALFQQMPLRAQGQLFDVARVRIVDRVPNGYTARAWDLAATGGGSGNPDWTVGLKLVRDSAGMFFVDDIIRLRGPPADVVDAIKVAAAQDGPDVIIGLPRDPGQAGHTQVLFLTQALAGYRVQSSPETGAKSVRAMPVAAQTAAGNLSIRRAPWNAAFLDELAEFPSGSKDDQVDDLSRAFMMLLGPTASARFASMDFFAR